MAYRDSSAVDSPQSQRLSNSFARAVQPLSPKTAANYRRIFYSLVSRTSALLDLAPDTVSVADLIEQLHSDPTIKVDSKRTYRAAIAWALRQPDIELFKRLAKKVLRSSRHTTPAMVWNRKWSETPAYRPARFPTRIWARS